MIWRVVFFYFLDIFGFNLITVKILLRILKVSSYVRDVLLYSIIAVDFTFLEFIII